MFVSVTFFSEVWFSHRERALSTAVSAIVGPKVREGLNMEVIEGVCGGGLSLSLSPPPLVSLPLPIPLPPSPSPSDRPSLVGGLATDGACGHEPSHTAHTVITAAETTVPCVVVASPS